MYKKHILFLITFIVDISLASNVYFMRPTMSITLYEPRETHQSVAPGIEIGYLYNICHECQMSSIALQYSLSLNQRSSLHSRRPVYLDRFNEATIDRFILSEKGFGETIRYRAIYDVSAAIGIGLAKEKFNVIAGLSGILRSMQIGNKKNILLYNSSIKKPTGSTIFDESLLVPGAGVFIKSSFTKNAYKALGVGIGLSISYDIMFPNSYQSLRIGFNDMAVENKDRNVILDIASDYTLQKKLMSNTLHSCNLGIILTIFIAA